MGEDQYPKAPKRFVIQSLINNLQKMGNDGDQLLAGLFTEIHNGDFLHANSEATRAILRLKELAERDKQRKKDEHEKKEQESRSRENEKYRTAAKAYAAKENERSNFLNEYFHLAEARNPQQRGYSFEKFLNRYFEFENLQPKGSFRVIREQIDGSFIWTANTHLVEAKWQADQVSGAEFGAFIFKLEGKSADTRGLYVSINGYSEQSLEALKGKGETRFVAIDGAHIARSLQPGQSLPDLLKVIWRHASETGESYLPVNRLP